MHNPFRYFNSSPEVIRSAVMLYVRYPLSLRQVEDLLFERGIDICHETVRYWCNLSLTKTCPGARHGRGQGFPDRVPAPPRRISTYPFRKPHPHMDGLHHEDPRIRFSGRTATYLRLEPVALVRPPSNNLEGGTLSA